jgi:PAS domain S-box-containing protein
VGPLAADADAFVDGMDRVVHLLEEESASRIEELERAESMLLAVVLAVLALEALLVFRPAAQRIEALVADQRAAAARLEQQNEALRAQGEELARRGEALRRERALSHAIVASSTDGLFAVDLDHRFVEWNPAMERIAGYCRDEVLGEAAHDIFPFLESPDVQAHVQRLLDEGSAYTAERRLPAPGGGLVVLENVVSAIRDPERGVVGMLCAVRDTTARRAAEATLRESEARQRTVLDAMREGVVLFGAAGGPETWNPSASASSGSPPRSSGRGRCATRAGSCCGRTARSGPSTSSRWRARCAPASRW